MRKGPLVAATAAAAIWVGSKFFYPRKKRELQRFAEAASNDKAARSWTPEPRSATISKLKSAQDFDILIIGAGATGAGCALDAAARGLKVACIDGGDFASGTSSKSTKLVHGGVRYLEKAIKNLDYEQYKLVREALSERATFLKVAPHLSSELPIILPIYKWWQVPYFWIGAKFYDLLAGSQSLSPSYFISASKTLEEFPGLKKSGLCGAIVYYDGQQNDSRMNLALVQTAVYHGASAANYVRALRLVKKDSKVCGAACRDELTGEDFAIRAKVVINATGPYSDTIRHMDDQTTPPLMAPSSGTHIVLPRRFAPKSEMGLIDPHSSDGRVIFLLPWEGFALAGTTAALNPIPTKKDVQFILSEVQSYFEQDVQPHESDILSAWTGIRPLVRDGGCASTQQVVRSHYIDQSSSGLVTVAGGKWTTYRKMAEETIDFVVGRFGLAPRSKNSATENILLIGGHCYHKTLASELCDEYSLDKESAEYLARAYGDRGKLVAELSHQLGHQRLSSEHCFLKAEVIYACRNEFAARVEDVIARRVRLAFIDNRAAFDSLPSIVETMARELRWSKKQAMIECLRAASFLDEMGLSLNEPFQERLAQANFDSFQRFLKISSDGEASASDAMKCFGISCDLQSKVRFSDFISLLRVSSLTFGEK